MMPLKVLITEDDQDVGTIMSQLLEMNGLETRLLSDPTQFQQAFQEFQPDMVVTDVMMPKVDGWTICKLVKENPNTAHIPVIVLTGRSDSDSELKSFECGANDYLSKPFENDEFVHRVKKLLKIKKPSSL